MLLKSNIDKYISSMEPINMTACAIDRMGLLFESLGGQSEPGVVSMAQITGHVSGITHWRLSCLQRMT